MKILIIINDAPYGTERMYNGLRLANALKPGNEVTVFLMADAVTGAKSGQAVPAGYYNVEHMLHKLAQGGRILLCGTCMDARGVTEQEILTGARRSTLDELARETAAADKVLVF